MDVKQRTRSRDLLAQRDTLLSQLSEQEAQLEELQSCLDLLTQSMDSIAVQENMLFLPDPENPDKPLGKKQIRERLEAFSELVARQHALIASLEDSLDTKNEALSSIRNLVAHYKHEIEQKDAEIAKMRQELKSKNASIAALNTKVQEMEIDIRSKDSDIVHLTDVSDQQKKIMDAQDNILNEGYYIVKSKKELSALGIKSNDISKTDINLSDFVKVDIRSFNELTIMSSKVKILTPMPTSSYQLIDNEDKTTTLSISDPADFWQYSNILIIQTR
jgi:uncharacterized coiled-coil DUF342 family protein